MSYAIVRSLVLSILPCLIPPYALRLSRVFGTKRVGWVLFIVFSLLATLQVLRAWPTTTTWFSPGLAMDLVNFFVPVLMLVGMVHIELVFKQRLQLEVEQRQLRGELEIQVGE